jgi:hypothetical protein
MAATWTRLRSIGAASAAVWLAALVHFPALSQPLSPAGVALPGFPVVTGFSGARSSAPLRPGGDPADTNTIDLNGPSLRVIDTSDMGGPPSAQAVPAPKPLTIAAGQIGQVFAITFDDAVPVNIYAAASSAYGLPIVVPDPNGLPARARKGAPEAQFMPGLFGPAAAGGGPGSIWRIDGRTGALSLFANVMLDGVPNSGPALGGIAFDRTSRRIFVADRDTGMVHSFDLGGRETARFDHGAQALPTIGLPPLPFDPRKRLDIRTPAFDSESAATWNFAPPSRRVFGLAVNRGRLYYAVAAGNRIWSVTIGEDGSFGADARVEYVVPNGPVPGTEISKIIFDDAGDMLLAERGGPTGAYDFDALTAQNSGRVLRLRAQQPGADGSPFFWAPVGDYAIGFPPIFQNGDGGIAIGYGYGLSGLATAGACGGMLWTTGSRLRISPDLATAQRLARGGPFPIDGLQSNAVSLLRPQNTPPFSSYFIDFDDRTDVADGPGHMGDVIVWRACQPAPGPVIAEYAPVLLELALQDLSCRADEIFHDGRCDRPQCEASLRGEACCPRQTSWNPRNRSCEPHQPGRPDLQVVKKVKDKNCGQYGQGACAFEIIVTNVGDAPYTGPPIFIGDIMVGGSASVTAVSIPAGFTCGPISLPAGAPSGAAALGCSGNAMLAPGAPPLVFTFSGDTPTSRSGWKNCAAVFAKLPGPTNPGSASNGAGLVQATPANVSNGALQQLSDSLRMQGAADPSVETNLGNNTSCISNEDNPKLYCDSGMIPTLRGGCCTPESIALGTCGNATTTTSCPLNANGTCCTRDEISAGRCGGTPTKTSCPSNAFPFNGACCTRKELDDGSCGSATTTVSCPFPLFAVNGKCCTRDGKCEGTPVNCPPGSPLCSPTRTSDCPNNAQRINGQCPGSVGCAAGQFRGDNGKCQKAPSVVTNTGGCGEGQVLGSNGKCQSQKTGDHSCKEAGFSWDGRRCVPSGNTTTQTNTKGSTNTTTSKTSNGPVVAGNKNVNSSILQNSGQLNRVNGGGMPNVPIQHGMQTGLPGRKF